jgi:glucokinase
MEQHRVTHGAVAAVDVGGTTIKGAVVDGAGAFLCERSRPTPAAEGPDAVIGALLELIAELAADGDVAAVGVVVPGAVDAAAGRAVFSANLGFRGEPLREIVAEATGLPALLEHDVRAADVAEQELGVTAGVEDYVLAVIGTGIAAVIRTGGKRVVGATKVPGELGHIPVWPGGEQCSCGQRGCLERYASAAAIARRYAEAGGEPGLSAIDVIARRADDGLAARVWAEAVEALALAFTTCKFLLDPALIVLAGGLSEAGDALLEPVQQELAKLVLWREPPVVKLSPLGGRAGLVGAALLARRLV